MTEENKAGAGEKGANENKQEFIIQKIFVKDASFEAPGTPGIFTEKWEPQVNLELNTAGKSLENNVHEVVLTLTITAKLGDKTAYLIEVQQAGLFSVLGLSEQEMSHALGSYCPNILFPYAREVVSDLVNKGGFPQLLLSPVNFDALYAQHMQRMQQQGQGEAQPENAH